MGDRFHENGMLMGCLPLSFTELCLRPRMGSPLAAQQPVTLELGFLRPFRLMSLQIPTGLCSASRKVFP